MFTDISIEEIEHVYSSLKGSELNIAKRRLADEVTAMLHGKLSLDAIHETVKALYPDSKTSHGLSNDDLLDSLPHIDVFVNESCNSINLIDLLLKLEFSSSKADSRRQLAAGAVRVDDQKVVEAIVPIDLDRVKKTSSNYRLKLSSGKRKHAVIHLKYQQK
jgi:tyrosyl-tRNA synthetase